MELALGQALEAFHLGEVPVGALVVANGSVVAGAHNLRKTNSDPTAHAEILALREAASRLGTWQLTDCTLYVTLEPCPMCAGALVNARVKRLVYGCSDPKAGAVATLYRICEDTRLNHRLVVTGGLLAPRCAALLSEFFSRLRSQKRVTCAEP